MTKCIICEMNCQAMSKQPEVCTECILRPDWFSIYTKKKANAGL